MLFHAGINVLYFGHLIGLFTPIRLLDARGISYGLQQWMAVLIGGIAGAAAFFGCSILLHHRLHARYQCAGTGSCGDRGRAG